MGTPPTSIVHELTDLEYITEYTVSTDKPSNDLERLAKKGVLTLGSEQPSDVADRVSGERCFVRVNSDLFDCQETLAAFYPSISEGSTIAITGRAATGRGTVGPTSIGSSDSSPVASFCSERCLDYYTVNGWSFIHKPYGHLSKYRNKHEGERVFLVGNGPSLKDTDLDLIKDEHAIAMNRISLLYEETDWRPSYYLFASDNVRNTEWGAEWQKSVNEAVSEPKTTSFVWDRYLDVVDSASNLEPLHRVTERSIAETGTFSTNASQWVSKTGTSMNIALQLAYLMGFEQIFFIGCDMNWSSTSSSKNDPNHFDDDYSARIPNGELERRRMRRTHQHAYQFFQDSNRNLYNATLETLLDVYPLVEFDSIASDSEWAGSGSDQKSPQIQQKRQKIEYYWKIGRYPKWIYNTIRLFPHRIAVQIGRLFNRDTSG
ncbi:hypothetical protein EXE53_16030 [Halorubrum sp. SD626R]|uniref:hypothetical protein n=1 Tax=Halorubrum sp. SD626R TaxID=1419722 RepID=UPI0010F93D83|nr:hypothetical protein [Halorubrum sp. SD626R]TKX79403.1 hypothetical protein EXE53_16030 [Halorubrum sp. SD626R]